MGTAFTRRNFLQVAGASVGAAALGLSTAPSAASAAALAAEPAAEDGYEMWLRYRPVTDPDRLADYQARLGELAVAEAEPAIRSAAGELGHALGILLGRPVPVLARPSGPRSLVIGTWAGSPLVRELVTRGDVERVGAEGYLLRTVRTAQGEHVVVAATSGKGVLYGAFALLRRLQRNLPIAGMDIRERPTNPLRLVNHWDNLNGTVERGYAGGSIFRWQELPELHPRYTDYARALASLGINGTVVNNVNANPQFLTPQMIARLAALAGALRPWGIRFHLSANFASPLALRELDTADPQDSRVQDWWRRKADQIYEAIPDFGGFLVKANSEGQPGPTDYGRTHADGANMLARAVAPHGGIVMWRAFVYDSRDGDVSTDAFHTFKPLDGAFDDNVILQAKYGPVDFHIREPVHPLFGAMRDTNMMIELQVTQEHTGHDSDLCYLPTWWRQVLDFDTYAEGPGTTAARIVDGTAFGYSRCGAAGVINFGDDRNWTGSHLAAANTHGYGRLLWNPAQAPADLAREWVELTFGPGAGVTEPLTEMLLGSWKTFEDYTSPLGVGNMVAAAGDHYAPDPRASQSAHKSDEHGTGFDRTVATGTGFTGLYHQPWRRTYEDLSTCPDELLLFMHHVDYQHRLKSGRTVIDHIYESHFRGLEAVHRYRETWRGLESKVNSRRFSEILATFDRHVLQATAWRDSIVSYYFGLSRLLASERRWVQIESPPSAGLLLGGWPTRVPMTAGNASPDTLALTARVDVPDGWSARPAGTAVPARQFASLVPTVVPPVEGLTTTLQVDVDAKGLPVIGGSGVRFAVAPAPPLCHLALDAGPSGSPRFGGYAPLSPGDSWSAERGYGWVGGTPQSRDRGGPDDLRRDFCNDAVARTLRIAVPAGRHDTYLLVGDAAAGSEPTIVRSGGVELGRSSRLRGGEFQWIRFLLDGGDAGRPVDLAVSSVPGAHWHLNAVAIVDATAAPPPVVVGDVSPAAILLLPDTPAEVTFWLYNFTDTDVAVEPVLTVPPGYSADLAAPRLTVPASGEAEVTVTVTREPGTSVAGSMSFALQGDTRQVSLRPTDNWMRIAAISAASTNAPSSVETLNDGDTNSDRWGAGGANGWNDGTPSVFPDAVTATWSHPVPLSRVKVYTLDSTTYPARDWGVRDYDLELRVGGAWTVVAEVRDSVQGVIESRFATSRADALRITVHDSNDHAYSRLIEIEAYSE
ncbi:twin-arginine translocation signal domain-containing protein [Micromonospora sp. U56]|uniref:alpha-glucuronidase family glycosyl hydrolase n=1 Tax=Micromonospora sp. U56 TaxID=2824900 RepID=UPI001B371F7C|nr:alpha-glucuronidase family glycosyl hydrolase [Micromonospora sp. U56]MBQ0895656.1 twin-arginine translocation signal domain-containing protein [Micromonospora sp. U56]